MKHSLNLGTILSYSELEDFLEKMDDAAADWLGLEEEDLKEVTHVNVTFETPDPE